MLVFFFLLLNPDSNVGFVGRLNKLFLRAVIFIQHPCANIPWLPPCRPENEHFKIYYILTTRCKTNTSKMLIKTTDGWLKFMLCETQVRNYLPTQ